jgi:hypothetical protein
VICLVSRGLGNIAPSQDPRGLVRIQQLPPNRNPLFTRDSADKCFMHPEALAFLLDVGDMVVNGAKIESWSVLVYLLLSQLGMPPQR